MKTNTMIPPKKKRFFIASTVKNEAQYVRRSNEGGYVLVSEKRKGDLFLNEEIPDAVIELGLGNYQTIKANIQDFRRWIASTGGRQTSPARKAAARKAATIRHARNRAIKDAQ